MQNTFYHSTLSMIACLSVLTLLAGCPESNTPLPPAEPYDSGMADMNNDKDMNTPLDMGEDMNMTGCVSTGSDDPDPDGIDSNCDGVDGDYLRSIFVASHGDDANPGSRMLPKKTINAGILAAKGDDARNWVIVENGLYEEKVILSDGIGVVGGYRFGWKRDNKTYATIRGGKPAIEGKDIMTPTVLMGLDVQPAPDTSMDETIITIALENSPGVTLRQMIITGGTAGDGANGTDGMAGTKGTTGSKGGNGVEDDGISCDNNPAPTPGAGATSPCGGPKGGKGGRAGFPDVNSAGAGEAGSGGAAGGTAATGERQVGGNAGVGGGGAPGDPADGGGSAGMFESRKWVGQAGLSGAEGMSGASGGGGGGGGHRKETFCDSSGGAGGGGGSGGCGGKGGGGGQPGGASVAIFLLDSDIVIQDCRINVGVGGKGGDGGNGGRGGDGGAGGAGGVGEDGSGAGGKGGAGGQGGIGGAGGGGSGGPSIGIYSNIELTTMPMNNDYFQGQGGFGGNGLGANGRGASAPTLELHVGPLQ